MTPGQAAYEAYVTFTGLPLSDWPWEADDVNQPLWEVVASAAIAASPDRRGIQVGNGNSQINSF